MRPLLTTVKFILDHPLNRGAAPRALLRYLKWQIGSRLVPGKVAVPFAGGARLLVATGMTGATQNIYTGLQEFEDMSFVLHALRRDELFVDVGANIGSYAILAAAVAGAVVLAAEPVPSTFGHLMENIRLNDVGARVDARRVAVGSREGSLAMSAALDTMNHILSDGEEVTDSVIVPVVTLDALVAERAPAIVKIDVEGLETNVIAGGRETLASKGLVAVVMELNGNGARYGFDEAKLHATMLALGFAPYRYKPFEREFVAHDDRNRSGNTLYLRDLAAIAARVKAAPRRSIHGREF